MAARGCAVYRLRWTLSCRVQARCMWNRCTIFGARTPRGECFGGRCDWYIADLTTDIVRLTRISPPPSHHQQRARILGDVFRQPRFWYGCVSRISGSAICGGFYRCFWCGATCLGSCGKVRLTGSVLPDPGVSGAWSRNGQSRSFGYSRVSESQRPPSRARLQVSRVQGRGP